METSGELKCQGCGQSFLHHREVRVFDRREDSDECCLTTVTVRGTDFDCEPGLSGSNVRVSPNASSTECPSRRRGSVVIRFECEVCDVATVLCINQHKGSTQWELASEATEGAGDGT